MVVFVVALVSGLFLVTGAHAQSGSEDYYITVSPFLQKIPLAVPHFKISAGSEPNADNARAAADLLARSLEFTGYFKLLDRAAFLYNPQQGGVLAADLNFQNWSVIGTELLTTGYFEQTGDNIRLELRLFDIVKAKRVLGKRYTGPVTNMRNMIHRFCSEVIFYLTGSKGFFQSKIAFVSTGSGSKEIYTCDFDGQNLTRLTYHDSISLSPAWSSDGRWVAYTSYKAGKPDIFIRNIASKEEASVSRKGINITPAWVPGKFELAATLSYSGDQEIYLLTGKGKVIKKLTGKLGIDISPAWSPDGTKLAFVSSRSGNPQIYILEVGSGKVRRLTYDGGYNTQPSWSPRGDKIAFSSRADGRFNIFVIGVDGQNIAQLTSEVGDNESPSWSPDGSLIVFHSTREGPSRLYVMTALGTDQRRLLRINGEQTNPKWSSNTFNN